MFLVLLVSSLLISAANAQMNSMNFPHTYSLQGKSGYKEKFSPELYDKSEDKKIVLIGLEDSLQTSVRRLISSYDQLGYLIFDNFYYESGQIKNETNVQSIYFSGERKQVGDWGLIRKNRLSNGNILVVASIHHVSKTITYIYRFLIFDKTGKTLLSQSDYCFLEEPRILSEINGGFSTVISKDYTPILIANYIISGNAKVEESANVYRQSTPAISITRFDNEGAVVKKNSYMIQKDSNIKRDQILDVISDSYYNYVLLISNTSGVVNQPTLASLIVQRDKPSVFTIENLFEDNSINSIDGSYFKKLYGRIFAYLPRPQMDIMIKGIAKPSEPKPQLTESKPTVSEPVKKPVDPLVGKREKANEILSINGIASECVTYNETEVGTFIGIRLADKTPVNYLFADGKLTVVQALNSYTIYEYSSKHNALIVGFYDKTIRFPDTMSRDFSIYKLDSDQLIKQVKYNVDVYRVRLSSDQDSLILHPNFKNPDGVGSTPKRTATKIKIN